jgi:predicted DNA-binding transcriptional regulator AlpA
MARQVDLDNRDQVVAFLDEHVLNAEKVGELAGLTRNSVYVYAGRDGLGFPEPLPFGSPRCQFWLRQDILNWIETRRA